MRIRTTIVIDREIDEDEYNWLHSRNLLDSTRLTAHYMADEEFVADLLDDFYADEIISLNLEVLND